MRWLMTGLALALLASGVLVPAPASAYAAGPTIGAGGEAQVVPMVGTDRIEKSKKSSKSKTKNKSKNRSKNDTTPTVNFSTGPGPARSPLTR